MHDAHRQIGLDPPQTIHDDDGESYDFPAMGWRFPCMIGHEVPRALTISLGDGSKVEFETKSVSVKVNAAEVATLLNRYGGNPFEVGHDYKTDVELAAGYFAMARAVFLRDKHHKSILLLFRDRKLVKPIEIRTENVQQKYIVMRQLANEVTKSGADTVILVSEVWEAPANELKAYERPADSPVRTEALSLHLVSKSGEPLDFHAKIVREGERVSLGNTEIADEVSSFACAPFYQAWGRPVPQRWKDIGRAMIGGRNTSRSHKAHYVQSRHAPQNF